MEPPSPQPVEIEAKFSIANAQLLHELAAPSLSMSGYRFGAAIIKQVMDIYLDTPDYRLLRTGYQLRARRIDGQWLATLKARGVGSDIGIYHRLEIEAPLATAGAPTAINDLPPAIIEALTGIITPAQSLTNLCVIDQIRRVRDVTAGAPGRRRNTAQRLAILSLDEMVIRQCENDPPLARLYEIEVELVPGVDTAELQVLADRLIGAYALLPSQESKLERALSVLSRHPAGSPENWQGLQPAMHMGEACRIIWHEQFMKMLLNEAGVRFGADPEFVHDARVAIRRARAATRIYQGYFQPKAVRRYFKRLRKTARLLGAVRDLDVAIAKLERYQQKTRKRSQGDLQSTLSAWLAKRSAAHQALTVWLESAEYADFVTMFLAFCRTPGAGIIDMNPKSGEEVTPFQVRHVTPTMLLNNFARVRSYEVWFDGAEAPPVETIHRLRIECKYLRYNLEFMAGLLGPESGEIIALLRKLQDDLGDLNDAVVSRQLLSTSEAGATATVTRYEQAQQQIIDTLRDQLRGDFARFVAAENRTRLLAAVAKI